MTRASDDKGRTTRVNRDDPGMADLARGANGLTEATEEARRKMMSAQLEAMNAMFTVSMTATATSFRAMAQFWNAALPGKRSGRQDRDDG